MTAKQKHITATIRSNLMARKSKIIDLCLIAVAVITISPIGGQIIASLLGSDLAFKRNSSYRFCLAAGHEAHPLRCRLLNGGRVLMRAGG